VASAQLQIDGVVLAGGLSRRMGGVDKALVDYQGRPLFKYAVSNLSSHVRRVWINRSTGATADTTFPRSPNYDIFHDQQFVGDGPLSGIFNAFTVSDADFLMIAPCDQLPLPPNVYADLRDAATPMSGTYATDGTNVVPTCAVLPRSVHPELEAALMTGELRLTRFVQAHARPVIFADVMFGNINSTDQL